MPKKSATIRDIARHCGYSHVTVSMVLNNRKDYAVAPATRARIVEAAKHMDYVPNLLGRALVSGKTQTITLWINRLNSSIYAKYYAALQVVVTQAGYHLALSEGRIFDDPYSRSAPRAEWPTDGIFAVDCPARVEEWLTARGQHSTPIVSLGAFTSEMVDSVHVDLGSGTHDAMAHLIASGRTRIEYLGEKGTLEAEKMEVRQAIYSSMMTGAGLTPACIVAESSQRASIYEAVRRRLERAPAPDAIFAHTDMEAMAAIRAVLDAGFTIPGDIAIMGVDGIEEAEYTEPTLSTVVQPVDEAARLAWEMLDARMSGSDGETRRTVIPTELVVRRSSAAPAK